MAKFQRELAAVYLRALVFAAFFGAIGAAAAQGFRWSLEHASELLFRSDEDVTAVMGGLPWHWQILVPVVGGALAGLILKFAQREEKKSGRGDYLEVIDGSIDTIPLRSSLLRCLSSFCSILSGGSVGKEGAMVQLSATAGSVCTRLGLDLHGERFQLAIALAGTGGLAAVYHTPLAAAVFIAEIAFGGIEFRRLALLFTAAVAATWVTILSGQYNPSFLLPMQEFRLDAGAMLTVMGIGVACGLTGSLLLAAINLARKNFAKIPGGAVTQMAIGGLLVGLIITAAPEVAGNGFAPISRLLHDQPVSVALIALLALKIGATAATVGSGAVGGLFTPALLVGALTAMQCVTTLNHALPGLNESVILFGVVGMAATLAATTQAPLMSTLMVFEMTREPLLIFPIMLATIIAYGTASVLGQTGTYAVTSRHRERFDTRSKLLEISVGMMMRPLERFALHNATLEEARAQGAAEKNRFVFILDAERNFNGAVSMVDLMAASAGGAPPRDLSSFLLPEFPTVRATDRVRDVWETVVASPAERVPVLADAQSRRVVGVLLKSDVLKRARDLFS
ncbi:MAG TPA: chloride channel protein [Burkholderiales bacterium]